MRSAGVDFMMRFDWASNVPTHAALRSGAATIADLLSPEN